MHKSRLAAFVIDSNVDDIEAAETFWGKALGLKTERSSEDGKYSDFQSADGEPCLLVQKVTHQSRIHLDIETDNIEAEVGRLEGLGASVIERLPRWVVMQAPTGHRFCVVNPQRSDFETARNVNQWPDKGREESHE